MGDPNFVELGLEKAKLATVADNEGKYEEALQLYLRTCEYFMTAIKCMCNQW
jgi:hypothetical protein